MQPQYKFCPRCNTSTDIHAPVCLQCGRQFQTQFHQTQQVPSPPHPVYPVPPAAFSCPVCGSPAVQKVSAICQAGRWDGQNVGLSVGHGHFSGGGSVNTVGANVGVSQGATQLAQLLSPPPRPTQPPNGFAIAAGCTGCLALPGGIVLLTALASGFKDIEGGALVVPIALLVVATGFTVEAVRQGRFARMKHQQNLMLWQQAMTQWDTLFYCGRCDNAYSPQTGQHAPPSHIGALVPYHPL